MRSPCRWHGYHFGTLYGSPKYSLYLRLPYRWDSSGHGRCNRKNETLVYQKKNLDLLLLKCKVQNEKKPVYSHSFVSHKNDLVWGDGVAVHGLLWGTIRWKLHFGREGGLKTAVYTIQFFRRDFSDKHVISPTPYQADLSLWINNIYFVF